MNKQCIRVLAIAIILVSCAPMVEATTGYEFFSYRKGSCYYDSLYSMYNDSDIYLGRVSSVGYKGYRGFIIFDLSTLDLSEHFIVSAKLTLKQVHYRSHDSSVSFGIYDVELPQIPRPPSKSEGLVLYTDLGSGISYGTATAYPQSDLFQIILSEEAIDDIADASGGDLAMGLARLGAVPNRGYSNNYIHIVGPPPSGEPCLELTVAPIPEPTLLLVDPNGGESLFSGQTNTINWSSTGVISEVLIEYSTNNGQDWNPVIPPNIGNTGSYSWSVPAVTSQQCLVRISDSGDLGVNDISGNVFEITELTLSLIKPNGGEAMLKGSTYEICWSGNLPDGNVLIEYSANNGQDWESIVTTEDTGSYEWQIDGPQSNQYLVRVSDANGWNVFDTSDSTFTVYTCQEQMVGDLNGDCIVDMVDFAMVSQNWLEKGYVRIFLSPLDVSPKWTIEGQWEFGLPTGNGGNEKGNPDPNSGYTGANVYGVNLNGDYTVAVGGPYYLTAGPFDCNKFHDMKLRFARWLNTDEPGYVASKIEVSNDGANWHTLWENTAAITDSNWQVVKYDVSETADNEATVYFRWGYEILDDRAYPYSGWNIDDIELIGKF